MNLKEMCEEVDWTHLAQNRDWWCVVCSCEPIMDLSFPEMLGILLMAEQLLASRELSSIKLVTVLSML